MDPTVASVCRKAAARCRKLAASGVNPKEWSAMAEQWDLLADTADDPFLAPSKYAQSSDAASVPRLFGPSQQDRRPAESSHPFSFRQFLGSRATFRHFQNRRPLV